jgi:plasmid segregation protein ParM
MKTGIDLGYNAVKAIGPNGPVYFPSVVGTPDKMRFSLNGDNSLVLSPAGMGSRMIGENAITQSRFIGRREDRGWINTDEWYYLLCASFTELSKRSVDLKVVTGLPVAFFDDKETVRRRLVGSHEIERAGRGKQVFTVSECRVIPQPFGAVLAESLNKSGKIIDGSLATGNVGVIDIGGKTTNLLSVHRLSEVSRETTSVSVGAWDAAREVGRFLKEDGRFAGLELRDHELADVVANRGVRAYGEWHELPNIDMALERMAEQIIAEATQLWNSGARLDAILVSGGGALLLGGHIVDAFKHARIVDNPVYANAEGYHRFAQRL